MKLKFTFLLISGWIAVMAITTNGNIEAIQLITKTTQFEAGQSITLSFSSNKDEAPSLYVSNSYGTTIIKSNLESGVLNFKIPQAICNKTGFVNWKLLNKNTISGKFNILSKQKTASLETYLGPPSIEAGGTDYSMLVVIPTDRYDNPLADSTKVSVKHQFLENQSNDNVIMKNRIAYKNIYSESKTGRILVSSECLGFNSKEYTVNVMPAIPTDFSISFQRNHNYADGNQITNFSTSIIKDKHDNIVSDGTYVEFFITNKSNAILKTSGTTVNGIANSKMIHPDHQDIWTVNAFVEGMAQSNQIELSFMPIVLDFKIIFSENNRTITVGPLKSFMNQMVPDGLEVILSVNDNDLKLQTLSKKSFEGFVTFKLDTNQFPNKSYTFRIETAGIEKTYRNIKL